MTDEDRIRALYINSIHMAREMTQIKVAYPSMAVEVSGFRTNPNAGDILLQFSSEEEGRRAVERKMEAENLVATSTLVCFLQI